jgi:hypothetical protein
MMFNCIRLSVWAFEFHRIETTIVRRNYLNKINTKNSGVDGSCRRDVKEGRKFCIAQRVSGQKFPRWESTMPQRCVKDLTIRILKIYKIQNGISKAKPTTLTYSSKCNFSKNMKSYSVAHHYTYKKTYIQSIEWNSVFNNVWFVSGNF